MWGNFKNHHYLSKDLNKSAKIYVAYLEDVLVAMCAVLPIPSGNIKHSFRPSRTVVLPDYQNLGIGTKFSEAIGDIYLEKGFKFYYRTSHLRLRNFFEHSPYWKESSHNNKKADKNKNFDNNATSFDRICGAYEYLGKNVESPHIDIIVDYNDKISLENFKNDLMFLKDKNYYLTVITGEVSKDNPIELICQELGIRTQLLYYRNKLVSSYKNRKIITQWDDNFSKEIRDFYN